MKTVIMDKDFTYKIDSSAKRTLPKGWRGTVTEKIWGLIRKEGAGHAAPEPEEAEPESGAPAAKTRSTKKGQAGGTKESKAAGDGAQAGLPGTGETADPDAAAGGA